MAYDPQQQRPEEQALNNNRESLNIRQPGETGSTGFDWEQVRKAREAAGRKSVVPDPSVGIKDLGLSAVSAPFDAISGLTQFAAGLNKNLDNTSKGRTLSDFGIDPAMQEVIRAKQRRIEDAQELQAENRDKLSQRKGLTATQTELRQLNNRIELVRIDRILTAEQKRERIDRFMARRNTLVQQAVERVNPYFNK